MDTGDRPRRLVLPIGIVAILAALGAGAALWLNARDGARPPAAGTAPGVAATPARSAASAVPAPAPRPPAPAPRAPAAKAPAAAPPTRLAQASGGVDDPGSPGYDPRHLQRAQGLTGADLWRREPRDDAWARTFESKLGEQLAEDLPNVAPDAKVKTLDCHTATCKLQITAPDAEAAKLGGIYPVFLLADEAQATGMSRDAAHHRQTWTFYLLFDPAHRASNTYDAWYAAYRARVLAKLRAAGLFGGHGPR